jgi:hypothetical protein
MRAEWDIFTMQNFVLFTTFQMKKVLDVSEFGLKSDVTISYTVNSLLG